MLSGEEKEQLVKMERRSCYANDSAFVCCTMPSHTCNMCYRATGSGTARRPRRGFFRFGAPNNEGNMRTHYVTPTTTDPSQKRSPAMSAVEEDSTTH